jgi:peptide/nickel transport system permease protein
MAETPIALGAGAPPPPAHAPDVAAGAARSLRADTWRRFRRHRLALFGLALLTLLVAAVVLGPFLLPYDGERIDFAAKDLPPSLTHPMGTDELGRDQFSRVLDGGRLTLAVAASAVLVSLVLGVLVGALAGYAGGLVDSALMRGVDVFYSLPALFVVILLVSLFGPGFLTIVVGIAALTWMNTARLVRASYLTLKEREFVEAARALGVPPLRIALRHILPNALGPVIVTATLGLAIAILIESGLSFLGLGFNPPQATWGGMLQESQRPVISDGHWWRGFFPGLTIFLTVLSANFVGDGLRDALDPRAAGRRRGA